MTLAEKILARATTNTHAASRSLKACDGFGDNIFPKEFYVSRDLLLRTIAFRLKREVDLIRILATSDSKILVTQRIIFPIECCTGFVKQNILSEAHVFMQHGFCF